MAQDRCQECEQLRSGQDYAFRSWASYRPMHDGHRPPSGWFKGDRDAKAVLDRAYKLAQAKYELHRATHETADAANIAQGLNVVIPRRKAETVKVKVSEKA